MTEIARFKMGSSYFFSSLPNYRVKDEDELILMTGWIPADTNVLNLKDGNKDTFFYKFMHKNEFILDTLRSGVAMRVGKFLIPEFAIYIGMTIKDLERLGPVFTNIDAKHRYEKVIYDAYITNGGWWLSDEQRQEAYNEYMDARK